MALQLISALCSVVLLSTLVVSLDTKELEAVPIIITVKNDFSVTSSSYHTSVLEGTVLYGALNSLKNSNTEFTFNVTLDSNYGLYLESVNGVAASNTKHTYWQILSEHDGTVTPLDVGVGCYQHRKDEHIILKYTTW